jgi:hypothetical protein
MPNLMTSSLAKMGLASDGVSAPMRGVIREPSAIADAEFSGRRNRLPAASPAGRRGLTSVAISSTRYAREPRDCESIPRHRQRLRRPSRNTSALARFECWQDWDSAVHRKSPRLLLTRNNSKSDSRSTSSRSRGRGGARNCER